MMSLHKIKAKYFPIESTNELSHLVARDQENETNQSIMSTNEISARSHTCLPMINFENTDNSNLEPTSKQWLIHSPLRMIITLTVVVSLGLLLHLSFSSQNQIQPALRSSAALNSNGNYYMNENIVHVKLSNNEYLATKPNGELITTKVKWIHGGRFELVKKGDTNIYQIKSMVTNNLIHINPNTMKLESIPSQQNTYSFWNLFSVSTTPSIPFNLISSFSSSESEHSSTHNTYLTKYNLELNLSDQTIQTSTSMQQSSRKMLSSSVILKNELTLESMSHGHKTSTIKGVNIGGWLIPERWMYPEFYNDVTPFLSQLCGIVKTLGSDIAEKRLITHLDTWLTTDDFDIFEKAGIRHLRLPIGYWNVIKSPYYFDQNLFVPVSLETSAYYLNWFLTEASNRDMSVVLDFHGAPGSQNGYDHSGCGYDSVDGEGWNSEEHKELSLKAIEIIAKEYVLKYPNTVTGIEILNEPAMDLEKNHHDDLLTFYQDAYKVIRSYCPEVLIILNVLWEKYYDDWKLEMIEPDYYNVAIDWHSYGFDNTDEDEQNDILSDRKKLIIDQSKTHPIIIGEWANYYHVKEGDDQFVSAPMSFFNNQLKTYNFAYGWYFWNFKVMPKEFIGWSLEGLVEDGYDFKTN